MTIPGAQPRACSDPGAALEAFVRDAAGADDVRVGPLTLPEHGCASIEVDLEVEGGSSAGAFRLVVELTGDQTPGTQTAHLALIEVVRSAGVPAPEPLWACDDAAVLGRAFHLLRVAPGVEAREPTPELLGALGASLARLHGVRPPWPGLDALEDPGPSVGVARVTELRGRLDRCSGPQPALEWVLRWLERRAPRFDEVVLGHGRLEPGACRVEGGALTAIGRWAGARWASLLEDLARLSLGFGLAGDPLPALFAGYEDEAGRALDTVELPFWLLLASAERAVEALEQQAPGDEREEGGPATPREILEAFARAEAMHRCGASASQGAIEEACRGVEAEILSARGPAGRVRSGAHHLEALYGEDIGPEGLSRFARDVRAGAFDGACARAARVLAVDWLADTVVPAGPPGGMGEPAADV